MGLKTAVCFHVRDNSCLMPSVPEFQGFCNGMYITWFKKFDHEWLKKDY